jgi:hypothetical protein
MQPTPPAEHVMRYGKHRGRPLRDVPTDYLCWALATCDNLSAGLRAAIRADLEGRPDCHALPPDPEPVVLRCRHCGSTRLRLGWQTLRGTGRRAIRRECKRCGRFCDFASQTPENVAAAERD